MLVTVSSQIDIFPQFYSRCAMNCKMTFVIEPFYVGKTSIGFIAKFIETATGEVLLQEKFDVACLDSSNRRAIAIPNDYLNRLKLHATGKKSDRVQIPDKPSVCYSLELVVVKSDYDLYGHVTRSVYIRYCLDAIHSAVLNKKFTRAIGNFDEYDVMQIISLYIKEIANFHKINVYVWEADVPNSFHCQIINVMGETHYKATVFYYMPTLASHL